MTEDDDNPEEEEDCSHGGTDVVHDIRAEALANFNGGNGEANVGKDVGVPV
jgi:hypothetical protein